MDDWRLTNQDNYLKGQELIRKKYQDRCTKTDHDHCEFCLEKFGEGQCDLQQGYCTKDDYHWICDKCYEDFKTQFNWIVNRRGDGSFVLPVLILGKIIEPPPWLQSMPEYDIF